MGEGGAETAAPIVAISILHALSLIFTAIVVPKADTPRTQTFMAKRPASSPLLVKSGLLVLVLFLLPCWTILFFSYCIIMLRRWEGPPLSQVETFAPAAAMSVLTVLGYLLAAGQ